MPARAAAVDGVKLKPEELASRLERGLAPIYLIGGDEPLLVLEAADTVRAHARAQGYTEREVHSVDAHFDWSLLAQAAASMSLFAERRIIELRMPGGKPGDAGSRALVAYAGAPPPDTLLLIVCGKLETSARNSKWYNALADAGVAVQVWPVDARALPAWISRRMRARGLQCPRDAVGLLAERVEGNLLAAAQEIEKLRLVLGSGAADLDTVADAVGDSARFDVFTLVDTALAGQTARAVRMLGGLRGEGVEPVLILWALAREVRALATMARAVADGKAIPAVLATHRVWEKRKGPIGAGLKRHDAAAWLRLLRQCARTDRIIKGMETGDPWDELLQLVVQITGVPLGTPRAGRLAAAV